jgi:hypothetical protein
MTRAKSKAKKKTFKRAAKTNGKGQGVIATIIATISRDKGHRSGMSCCSEKSFPAARSRRDDQYDSRPS